MAQVQEPVRILLSDIILHENDSSTAITRDAVDVTPPAGGVTFAASRVIAVLESFSCRMMSDNKIRTGS